MKTTQCALQIRTRSFHYLFLIFFILELISCSAEQEMLAIDDPVSPDQQQKSISSEGVIIHFEQMPYFPNGEKALRNFLTDSLRYPEDVMLNRIEGKAYVYFIIDFDGSVTDVRIARTAGNTLLDDEALRLIASLPDFISGKMKGEPWRFSYIVPVLFKLSD